MTHAMQTALHMRYSAEEAKRDVERCHLLKERPGSVNVASLELKDAPGLPHRDVAGVGHGPHLKQLPSLKVIA